MSASTTQRIERNIDRWFGMCAQCDFWDWSQTPQETLRRSQNHANECDHVVYVDDHRLTLEQMVVLEQVHQETKA